MEPDDRTRAGNAPWIKDEPSGKGLFSAPAKQGLTLRNRNRLRDKRRMDEFAELLAEGRTPAQAAREMGFLPSYGNAMLQRLRAKMGPQAI